jgi:hypothetical protein
MSPANSSTVLRLVLALNVLFLAGAATELSSHAFDWVPTDEEIKKYRQSWNPFSHGPILVQAVDIQPKGQLSIREFLFSQIGENSYGNRLSTPIDRKDGPVHLYQVNPSLNAAYGLSNHFEIGAALPVNAFWARQNGAVTHDAGLGDVSLIMKYRPVIQDPDGWRPSFTHFAQVVLPTSRWAGTERPPGGFSPLGRLPNTRFGELGITQGFMARKNLEPFRISSALFYTYSAPGSEGVTTTYSPDVINARLVVEHILDDKQGFGYNVEISTLHGLTWRADGHAMNRGQRNGFTIIGVEPAIQYKFGDAWVAAAGVLFTVAGQNAIDAIYPNISLYWYWSQSGKVIMR